MIEIVERLGFLACWFGTSAATARGPFGQAQWSVSQPKGNGAAIQPLGPFVGLWGEMAWGEATFEPMHY